MAEESAKLRIPYIAAAQAQKHVTHNEAMTLLDTLVQLSVIDKDLTAPPGSPDEGATYIVAGAGGTATGAWVGWEKRVARYIDGTWRSYLPGEGDGAGWLAWVIDEAKLYAFNGTNWVAAGLQFGAYLDLGEVSPPSSPAGDVARLYAKDVGGVTKLAFKDSAGMETVLGSGGGGASGFALVRAATTANITIATALNNGDTLDGVTLATGDLVLVKDQSSAADNGIYVVGASPARDSSFAAYDSHPGALISVQEGTANADTLWLCTSNKGGTLGATALAFAARRARDTLTANRTYYVRTDGSDSNNGLTNSSGGAFLTMQKAIDTCYSLDLAGFNVTIQVGNGTYATTTSVNVSVTKPFLGGIVTVVGDAATPSNVVLTTTTADVINVQNAGSYLQISGLQLDSTSGALVAVAKQGAVDIMGLMVYATTSGVHLQAATGGIIQVFANYTITTGTHGFHLLADGFGIVSAVGVTVTLTSTPAFTQYARATNGGYILGHGATFTGSATGQRYNGATNALIFTNGGGANYFPGNSAGATATGAQYS